jgi:hypothetical protein
MSDRTTTPEDEILPEYSLKGAVRGKYAARYAEGTNVVLLDEDAAEESPNSESVNQTVRELAETPGESAI